MESVKVFSILPKLTSEIMQEIDGRDAGQPTNTIHKSVDVEFSSFCRNYIRQMNFLFEPHIVEDSSWGMI